MDEARISAQPVMFSLKFHGTFFGYRIIRPREKTLFSFFWLLSYLLWVLIFQNGKVLIFRIACLLDHAAAFLRTLPYTHIFPKKYVMENYRQNSRFRHQVSYNMTLLLFMSSSGDKHHSSMARFISFLCSVTDDGWASSIISKI